MSQEDLVQRKTIYFGDFTIAGSALSVNKQSGGAIARTGAGILTVTLPAGRAIDLNNLEAQFTSKEGTGTFAVAVIDATNSTTTVIELNILDAAGAAVDDVSGAVSLDVVQFNA